jgi:hypothetical protein
VNFLFLVKMLTRDSGKKDNLPLPGLQRVDPQSAQPGSKRREMVALSDPRRIYRFERCQPGNICRVDNIKTFISEMA